MVQKRFGLQADSVELYAEKVNNRGLCAVAQAESLRYKLLGGLAVRRACYGVLRFVMESGAKGCEVIVSGKLRAQRAKSMKFKDGYMVSGGGATGWLGAGLRGSWGPIQRLLISRGGPENFSAALTAIEHVVGLQILRKGLLVDWTFNADSFNSQLLS